MCVVKNNKSHVSTQKMPADSPLLATVGLTENGAETLSSPPLTRNSLPAPRWLGRAAREETAFRSSSLLESRECHRVRSLFSLTLGTVLMTSGALADEKTEGAEAAERRDAQQSTEVVSVFEDRGILTTAGTFVVEPSISFTHTSATVVAIEGFTVIPALVVGLINVSQAQKDILNTSISLRYGISSRFEVGLKIPYLHIDESIRERQAFSGTPVDILNDSSGSGLGDIELTANYQFNDGLDGAPYLIGNLRIKSDTGDSPFEIPTVTKFDEDGKEIGQVFVEQPTGSGFWSAQIGLTASLPTDPAVLYGGLTYQFTMPDDKGEEFGGEIDPGDTAGVSFGIGFSVNEKTSFSLGYDHQVIFQSEIENDDNIVDSNFDQVHSGTLLLGLSHTFSSSTHLNLSLGVGVTESAPDMQLTLRTPIRF